MGLQVILLKRLKQLNLKQHVSLSLPLFPSTLSLAYFLLEFGPLLDSSDLEAGNDAEKRLYLFLWMDVLHWVFCRMNATIPFNYPVSEGQG